MLKLPYLLISRLGGVALIACIAWLGWQHLGPVKPDAGAPRMELLKEAVPEIVEDLRNARGDIRYTALLHFENDPSDRFTDTLRDAIEKQGILDLRDRPIVEKAFDLLNLRHPAYPDPDAARRRGRRLRVDGVIHGRIHAWETTPETTILDVEVFLTHVETGSVLFTKRYDSRTPESALAEAARVLPDPAKRARALQRLVVWVLIVLLLPVFTIAFLRAMVKKNSNSTNAFVLAIYTGADALLAWLLVGAIFSGWLAALFFLAAVTAASLYNVRIMTFALKLEEE